ncbi:MAG: 6-phosphofructokinase [Bdellovibrio sp. CG10_big_fil_rev_8_21_14_0_10_47_8]|nr:MAG: 6-phosphofructokinase [Bdellovibrio sp. CG10_big_fil_rev_8_21_14_0_10_47_8]
MAQFQKKIQRLGVFSSGGDAPGMNAAIRSIVRTAISHQIEVTAIIGGYPGMLEKNFQPLNLRSMANIIQRGGTVLKTGRSMEFHKPEYRKIAAENLKSAQIDAVVCIGGDGSFRGAHALWLEHQIPITGVPGTIDNDIFGTDNTIGFDTAVNTALQAIDKIRDTAASHDRLFIVEVMGRNSGLIASHVGLAGGAEIIFTPDVPITVDQAIDKIKAGQARGKMSSILITAEGQKPGRAYDLAEQIRKKAGLEAKVCILGHQQRGGSPTAFDRVLASRLGSVAVELLLQGQCDIMVGSQGEQIITVPLETAISKGKSTPRDYLSLANILAN